MDIQEKLYQNIFEDLPVATFLVDPQLNIIDANKAAKQLFDLTNNQSFDSVKLSGLIYVEVKGDLKKFKQRLFSQGQSSVRGTLKKVASVSNTSKTLQIKAVSVTGSQNYLCVLQDITQQEREYQKRERFVAVAGHELKNPVAVIKAYAELLQDRFVGKVGKKDLGYLQKIENKADVLHKMIRDLIDEIKTGSGSGNYVDTQFRLDELIEYVAEDINKVSDTHSVRFQNLDVATVVADRTRLMQVITNLITNAISYSPTAAHVVVSLQNKEGQAIFLVQDFGTGIAQKDWQHIFTPFFRNRSQAQQGTSSLGLGLYIARNIVEHYGGQIWFESVLGEGSTFYFSVPTT